MKKKGVYLFSAAVLLSSCGLGGKDLAYITNADGAIGSIIKAATHNETITNNNVIGASKITEEEL